MHPGKIYWAITKSNIAHPHLVIKVLADEVVVCQITTNQSKQSFPGNIVLDAEEGGLKKPSIIETSKCTQLKVSELGEKIGELSEYRVQQVLQELRYIEQRRGS